MKTEIKKPSYEVLCEAAELIKKGEVVAIPTETVYGLAADAYNPCLLYTSPSPRD